MSDLAKLFDVFFNGRPAEPPRNTKVTIDEIVRRGVSFVTYDGKLYRVEAKECEFTK